jgi:hypothetical protein
VNRTSVGIKEPLVDVHAKVVDKKPVEIGKEVEYIFAEGINSLFFKIGYLPFL